MISKETDVSVLQLFILDGFTTTCPRAIYWNLALWTFGYQAVVALEFTAG